MSKKRKKDGEGEGVLLDRLGLGSIGIRGPTEVGVIVGFVGNDVGETVGATVGGGRVGD